MAFQKGKSGNPAGKKPGTVNKVTRDIREFARECLESPDYVRRLKGRLEAGKAPHMETLLAHYAYGKPKDVVEINTPKPLLVDLVTDQDTAPKDE
jgi:acyl-CoA-binding protein